MSRVALPALALSLLLLGCPKNTPVTTLGGTDDEQMDAYAAQLEELHTRTNPQCSDWCSQKGKVCDMSKAVCEIAARHADRQDFQKKCVASQEECAHYNEACSSCSPK